MKAELDFGEWRIIHKYIPDQNYGNIHHTVLKQSKIHKKLKKIATRGQYLRLLSNLVLICDVLAYRSSVFIVNAFLGVLNSPHIFMKDIILFRHCSIPIIFPFYQLTHTLILVLYVGSNTNLIGYDLQYDIVTCQAHPALVKRVQCTVRSSF